MAFHRMLGDGQLIGDDFVGVPVPNHGQYLDLPFGQRIICGMVRQANQESEMRYTAQLDEAMATFAEIIMGGGAPAVLPATPPPPPRPAQRRVRARKAAEPEENGVLADAAS